MFDVFNNWHLNRGGQGKVIAILFLFAGSLFAQVSSDHADRQGESGFEIQWMKQIPGEEAAARSSVGERISALLFGKRQQAIVKPFNVAAPDPERVWILDQGGYSLVSYNDRTGRFSTSLKGGAASFPSLVGVCHLGGEEILFTDSRTNRVHLLSGGNLLRWADTVSFIQPTGIAYSPIRGEVWVVETAAHRISILDRNGELIRRMGQRGTGPASFNFPTFIWIDGEGRVYIVDSMNSRVMILDGDGRRINAFGERGDATGNMARPKGIATDSQGHIYVADALFHVVQVFDCEGRFLHSFGKQGQGSGEFWMPSGIYIDKKDRIYVADSYNSRIQVFQLVKI